LHEQEIKSAGDGTLAGGCKRRLPLADETGQLSPGEKWSSVSVAPCAASNGRRLIIAARYPYPPEVEANSALAMTDKLKICLFFLSLTLLVVSCFLRVFLDFPLWLPTMFACTTGTIAGSLAVDRFACWI
jgi:hypothetical protein